MKQQVRQFSTAVVSALALGVGIGLGQGFWGNHSGSPAWAQTASVRLAEEQNVIGVVRRLAPAVVTVLRGNGLGSGVVIDGKRGILLTNAHVVGDASEVGIQFKGRLPIRGKVLGKDTDIDVAVVQVGESDLPAAVLGNSDKLSVGQTAIAIGNPLGLEQSVTTGVVSAINRRRITNTDADGEGFIQTDAAINPGNSGGPLLDSGGNVIGINTAVLRGEGAEGLGLAVPINVARNAAQQIIATGRVRSVYIGVAGPSITPDIAQLYKLPASQGVFVAAIYRGSPAAAAGVRLKDIIIAANGQTVRETSDLRRVIRNKINGETVTLTVVRGNQRLNLRVKPATPVRLPQ